MAFPAISCAYPEGAISGTWKQLEAGCWKRVAGGGGTMDGFPLARLLLKAPGLLLIAKTTFSLADIFFLNGNPLDLMARHPLPKQIASLSEG